MSGGLDETADAGTGPAATEALTAGSYLGKYRLDRVLGEGGMGVVWAAHDPDLERAIAIKVLRYAQASQQLRQRLLREARAMAKLKHPNVLTVYEVGTVGERDYIAMELVDGMTLDAWLALAPPAEQIWAAVLAAGHGLAAAHDAGVVHRDFKPHNVLRSREGRILVTDFGLARGMLAEGESAALAADVTIDPPVTPFDKTLDVLAAPAASSPTPSERKGKTNDPLLDAPLTQTGALIGTPAYMAPEQYRGAPPDPRTDQFAFCVTAWQALTGERPFKGQTIDELRRSVSAGVAHVGARLPRSVRVVLARGLDPSAARRWPSLDALLEALEHAGKQPALRKRRVFALAGGAMFIALGLGLFAATRKGPRAHTGCDDPDQQFTEAWSPAARSALARKTAEPNVARIASQLDRYSEHWIESYAKACRGRPAKLSRQRIACLEGLRDHAAAITTMLAGVDAHVLAVFEPRDALPPIASCETASPLAPPRVPGEQPRRGKILSLIGRSLALRGVPAAKLGPAIDALLAEAAPLDWPPLAPLVLVSAAGQYMRSNQPALARATYERALASLPADAALRDLRVEGSAYLGLLDASLVELEQPNAPVPAAIRVPKAKAPLHPELALRIMKAKNAAGDDPLLIGASSLLAAIAYEHAAQWNRYPSGYADALQLIAEARKQFEAIGDVERAAYAASIEADVYLQRGDDRALDDALFAARRAQDALEAAGLPRMPALDEVRATVAFARGDYSGLYRVHKAEGHIDPMPASALLIHGRVTGNEARQVSVVAWKADAVGHAHDIALDPSTVTGTLARTDRDGTFTIQAQPGWAIMAESRDARSTPRLVGTGALALALEPTRTISGHVGGINWFGVRVFARYTTGTHHWTVTAPIERDGSYDLGGLPPGPRVYGTEGPAGTGTRTILAGTNPKQLRWSYGQALELIVRAKQLGAGARAWVIRGEHAVTSREQLDALVASAPDVAWSHLEPIGANNTDAGRELYRAGDRHAVITGNDEGQVYTACAAAGGAFACKTITVERTMSNEYADGRYGAGVTPILFEL